MKTVNDDGKVVAIRIFTPDNCKTLFADVAFESGRVDTIDWKDSMKRDMYIDEIDDNTLFFDERSKSFHGVLCSQED